MPLLKSKPKSTEKINPRALHSSYLDKIETHLESDGVVLFDTESGRLNIDDEYLVLPRDITNVSSRELGKYLNSFTQHRVYMRTVLGRTELCEEEAKRKFFLASQPIYSKYTRDKLTETAKDRLVCSNPESIAEYEAYSDWCRKKSIVRLALENTEDIIFMLSREVTRRNADLAGENRDHNVGRY